MDSSTKDNFNFIFNFNDRITASLKLGIKATKFITFYPFIGLSDVGYEVVGNNVNSSFFDNFGGTAASNNYRNFSNRESSSISGIGVLIDISKKLSLSIEYSKQDLDIYSRHKILFNGKFDSSIKSSIDSIKLGLTSKF